MSPEKYALILTEIRFIEKDLAMIAEAMETISHEIQDAKEAPN